MSLWRVITSYSIHYTKLYEAISEDAAKRSELGKEVLNRIESGEDCDMSTGLWLEADMADGA